MDAISSNKEKKRIQNLDETIYFLCFVKSHYVSEISKKLYNQKAESNRSYLSDKKLPELLKRGWIKKVPKETSSDVIAKEHKDGRMKARDYYESSPEPIISRIKVTSELDDFEEYILKDKIESAFFKNFVVDSLSLDLRHLPLDPFEYILSLLDMVFIEIDENIGLRELNVQLSIEIQTKKQYNLLKGNIKRVMREKLPELSGVYFDKDVSKDKKEQINFVGGKSVKQQNLKQKISVKPPFRSEDPSEWIEQFLIFLIIPDTLFHKIMEASNFGAAYYELKRRFKSCSALGNFYLGKLSQK